VPSLPNVPLPDLPDLPQIIEDALGGAGDTPRVLPREAEGVMDYLLGP
jgi:hypothetical protein